MESNLPRLVYYSDVVAEESGAGSTLLYRLLKHYPPDRLLIARRPSQMKADAKQLRNVHVLDLPHRLGENFLERLNRSRFSKLAAAVSWKQSNSVPRSVATSIRAFRPEMVLTVTHGMMWNSAVKLATACQLPYSLIVHDAFEFTANFSPSTLSVAMKAFTTAYRSASEVFCVSPYMAEHYSSLLQRNATVLLPSRDSENLVYRQPKQNLASDVRPLRIGYAGGLHNSGYRRLVERLAALATRHGMRVAIFGPHKPEFNSLDAVDHEGNLSSADLIQTLRDSVEVLFCPQSFDPAEKHAMATNFPSKLTDYTATGLPLLIWGPDYASSVKWAYEHAGVAAVVHQDTDEAAGKQLERLADVGLREKLAEKAIEVGATTFCAETAFATFAKQLSRSAVRRAFN